MRWVVDYRLFQRLRRLFQSLTPTFSEATPTFSEPQKLAYTDFFRGYTNLLFV